MNAEPSKRASLRLRFILAGVLAVGLGLGLAGWRIHQIDQQLREDLQQQGNLIAWALQAEQISTLTGTAADLAAPLYRRIKAQLMEARTLYPHSRFLYLMSKDAGGQINFLVDSEPAGSPDYSPPGQVYAEAPEAFRRTFRTGRPTTTGPFTDRWGTWVSASIPLFHPLSDRVVAVLGLDIDARQWRAHLFAPVHLIVLFTALALLVLAGGYALLNHQLAHPPARPRHPARSAEALLTIALGFILTLLAAVLTRENDLRMRHAAFHRLAGAQARLVQQAMYRIGDNYLEGMARFFVGSDFVDQREFRDYASLLVNWPLARAWSWIPKVDAADRQAFEHAVQAGGLADYRIWHYDPHLEPEPATGRDAYYPICYIEPHADNKQSLGFDLGSVPSGQAAMETAWRTRLTTATDPIALPQRLERRPTVLVFRPVFARDDTNRLSGFAMAALRMDAVLYQTMSRESTREETSTQVKLFQVKEGQSPLYLASNEPGKIHPWLPDQDPFFKPSDLPQLVAPIFAYGQVYALLALPGPEFEALYPARSARRTLAIGLVLTGMLTALVGMLTGRRAALEHLVATRTAELRQSESSYHGLFNSIQQAIYIVDAERRLMLDANDGAATMFGHAREDCINRGPEFLLAPDRTNLDEVWASLAQAALGQPRHMDLWGLRKTGDVFPVEVWLYPGTYFGRNVVIAIAMDISERTRAETEKNRLQSQLQQAQRLESVGRLAGGVAHDFNNMLQAILGNASLALEEAPNGPLTEYLVEIKKSAQRSADLTRQLLAFASRQTVSPRVIDLNDTIAGMLKMLRRLIGEDIQLLWSPGPDLWPIKVDPSQIDQIMANLAVNARDAIGGVGTVTIETTNLLCEGERCRQTFPDCPDGAYVLLTVRDTGKGMDQETRAHIFEPFYTTKGAGKGVGLGLATIFGIVKQNQGFIQVTSEPGQGACFQIGLPRTNLPVAQPEESASTKPWPGGTETLLLVEDERSVLRFAVETLRRLGYEVLSAATPGQALDVARRHPGPIHLLITDVVLPDMNGRELAQLLTALTPGLSCLFMSGYTADIIAHRGVLDEHVHFIQKPFSVEALALKIREVLDLQNASPA